MNSSRKWWKGVVEESKSLKRRDIVTLERNLIKVLKMLREKYVTSQSEIARFYGKRPNSYSYMEAGRKDTTYAYIEQTAAFLGISSIAIILIANYAYENEIDITEELIDRFIKIDVNNLIENALNIDT